jgi:hypothetical protein
VILGKLSAYRRKNHAKRTLWELDGIIRTPIDLDRLRQQLSSEEVSRLYPAVERYCMFSAVWVKTQMRLISCSSELDVWCIHGPRRGCGLE